MSRVLEVHTPRGQAWRRRLRFLLYLPLERYADLRNGLRWHFPWCCCLRFALGRGEQAVRRGIVDPYGPNPFVPCRIRHHGTAYADCSYPPDVDWDALSETWYHDAE